MSVALTLGVGPLAQKGLASMRSQLTIPERFFSKVQFTDTCWLWTDSHKTEGYGQFWAIDKNQLAHRWVYEFCVGPIPVGLQIDHLCRVRHCVNPDHLEPVTNRENVLRGISPPAIHARTTHCPRGHGYTPENTTVRGGQRFCLACREIHNRIYVEKRRARR